MTESSPVLTVHAARRQAACPGSRGPGAARHRRQDRSSPTQNGVGEMIAKGPNVMVGYFENPEATAQTLRDGWLHTGDLGRIDEDGNLFIVGRKKEMILGPAGENVYPDELEELYARLAVHQGAVRSSACPARAAARPWPRWSCPTTSKDADARGGPRRGARARAQDLQAAAAVQAGQGRPPVGRRSAARPARARSSAARWWPRSSAWSARWSARARPSRAARRPEGR